ncbi:hypothetical protein V1264_017817 [Littorina saxatilis]|uniref:Mammalian ependymin-related protein 1-like n=2 Tax=Littorina saxatilis TaxID=31220 RepID=A0AAN9BI53_9CAEN
MSLLYACVFVAVLGQGWSASPCCVPDAWEGIQSTVLGRVEQGMGVVVRTRTAVSYDYANRRVAAMSNVTLDGNKQQRMLNLMLYEEKTSYSLDLMTGMCTKQTLNTDMMAACVPDGAVKQGDVYFGSGLVTPLSATEWGFEMPSPGGGSLTGTVTVTSQCVPITEAVFGHVNGVQMLQAVEFVNIIPGIHNPDIFDIPEPCENAPEEYAEEGSLPGLFSV